MLPSSKVPISLRVDADVLEFFRERGPRYHSRMNAVLRSYMERMDKAMPGQASRDCIACIEADKRAMVAPGACTSYVPLPQQSDVRLYRSNPWHSNQKATTLSHRI